MKSIKQKQKEAFARQEVYNKLSFNDRLARLDREGLTATRERARIASQMATAKSSTKSVEKVQKKTAKA